MKNELNKMKRALCSDGLECPQGHWEEEEEELKYEDKEQRRRDQEAFLNITVSSLRRMKQGELADLLMSSKRISFESYYVGLQMICDL